MKRGICLVLSFVLIMGACIPAPASPTSPTESSASPTITALATETYTPVPSPSATATPTPTIEPTFTDTPTPLPTFTIVAPPPTTHPTRKPPRRPTDTPSATAELIASDTPTATITPTLACERETASVLLSSPVENLKIGEAARITITVKNEGCVALGLPQYRLYIQSSGTQPIFSPEFPEPLVHSLAVGPGQSDSAEFTLIAIAEGQATITAMVSYEVHLGYPGPAYWGATGSAQPLILTVVP